VTFTSSRGLRQVSLREIHVQVTLMQIKSNNYIKKNTKTRETLPISTYNGDSLSPHTNYLEIDWK
jgi:hypothetical protein